MAKFILLLASCAYQEFLGSEVEEITVTYKVRTIEPENRGRKDALGSAKTVYD